MTKKISIIGTSRITSHHVVAARKAGFKVYSISATRKKSEYIQYIAKKHNIDRYYFSWKECIKNSIENNKKISFVVTGPTVKNKPILDYLLKYNSKILIEKPVFNNHRKFRQLNQNKKNIFVGFNRIFYENIHIIKKRLQSKNNLNVVCAIPEINKKYISINSCHIFSILFFLFGDLRLVKRNKNKNFINVVLNSKNSEVSIFFNYNAAENFCIKIYDKETIYELKPIETLNIYKGMEAINIQNQNYYQPIKIFTKSIKSEKAKPGFLGQYLAFSKFVDGGKILNNIKFAEKIQSLIYKIIK